MTPLWTPTSSWALCLRLARSCPTTTSATSPDGDSLPVSWWRDASQYPSVGFKCSVFSVKLNVSYLSHCTLCSWWQPVQPAEGGLPSSGRPRGLLQQQLVGQHCQGHHGVWWRRCWVWMQRESPAAWWRKSGNVEKLCFNCISYLPLNHYDYNAEDALFRLLSGWLWRPSELFCWRKILRPWYRQLCVWLWM